MSIIYEALKKIEKNVNRPPSVEKSAQDKGIQERKKPNRLLMYILLVLTGLFAVKTGFKLLSPPPPTILQADVLPLAAEVAPKPVEEEKPVIIPDPVLSLNGTYFQGEQGYALINNRIVKPGDTIQGATVKEINLEKVVLEFEGRVITLVNSGR